MYNKCCVLLALMHESSFVFCTYLSVTPVDSRGCDIPYEQIYHITDLITVNSPLSGLMGGINTTSKQSP